MAERANKTQVPFPAYIRQHPSTPPTTYTHDRTRAGTPSHTTSKAVIDLCDRSECDGWLVTGPERAEGKSHHEGTSKLVYIWVSLLKCFTENKNIMIPTAYVSLSQGCDTTPLRARVLADHNLLQPKTDQPPRRRDCRIMSAHT